MVDETVKTSPLGKGVGIGLVDKLLLSSGQQMLMEVYDGWKKSKVLIDGSRCHRLQTLLRSPGMCWSKKTGGRFGRRTILQWWLATD